MVEIKILCKFITFFWNRCTILEKLDYFCIVNTINKHILRHLTLFLVLFLPLGVNASPNGSSDSAGSSTAVIDDDVRISLLTCSPHQEVYSLYGHTALHVVDKKHGIDVAVNYGVFNFDKPFFILRFIFGLTDYEMGVVPYHLFCEEYRYYGCEVTEQEFDLTTEEKSRIMQALAENDKEENRVYRYNYFYDNCTSRARDIVVDNIDGTLAWNTPVPEGTTYRSIIHEKTHGHPWAQFGNDLLLGAGADRLLTTEQYICLPALTQKALQNATITRTETKKLISNTSLVLKGTPQEIEKEFPLTPLQVSGILGLLCLAVTYTEWKKKLCLWWFDAALMILQGLCGLVLTAMIFSEHPTVSVNTQLLLLNPLPLFFGWQALRRCRRGEKHWLWQAECMLFALFMVLTAFNVQWIDPAMKVLACCLIIRYGMRFAQTNKRLNG